MPACVAYVQGMAGLKCTVGSLNERNAAMWARHLSMAYHRDIESSTRGSLLLGLGTKPQREHQLHSETDQPSRISHSTTHVDSTSHNSRACTGKQHVSTCEQAEPWDHLLTQL